ncbi:MAG: DUF2059 domain-containing protein [Sphingomonas sp.]|uniref:hypothetical protein n=1 Tax=Sphingomonas sp. TaxID=28214 RepID=UPI0012271242|nr:hypothetical protein [Sphingomonas sp.]THD37879.1 MAG: DUF2059 domain-containing protein [Sphingomonas sp.]
MVRALTAAAALLLATSAVAQSQPAPAPSPEAETLGRRVADTGTLAALLPLVVAKDTEEMLAEHPELDAAGKAKLRAIAADTAKTAVDRMLGVVGHQYALRLSVEDLKALVAFNQSAAAKASRAAEPQVIVATMQTIDGFDLKKEAWAAYCRSPGITCPAPAK